jgi:lipopolysaccharide/colanic/teichoic acid biosynthesis glycosyltransferase
MSLAYQTPERSGSADASNGYRPRTALGHLYVLEEDGFHEAIRRERRRSERSAKSFVLMLVRFRQRLKNGSGIRPVHKLAAALRDSVRETDTMGWYQEGRSLGVIFTELGDANRSVVLASLKQRVAKAISSNFLELESLAPAFTFHFFPEEPGSGGHAMDFSLYPELYQATWVTKVARGIKRLIDLLGSALALTLLLGLLIAIALLIKLTSKGPILFRQTRIGQHGNAFTFFKFRSMYVNNDATIHKEYVARLIAGQTELSGAPGVYKITNDPRVTSVGRFLRRTSLDELPQLLNVLKGEMSLVGPRPPLPYEYEHYDIWHRRRILEVRPGLTGLWQVNGRSRTCFDDMVRLDLKYTAQWSLWLDLKIFLLTPKAVLFGDGAY